MASIAYQKITDRILDLLSHGTVPWHKPWAVGAQAPQNLFSRRPYRGINVCVLGAMGYAAPF
jgi:antirestriction protein ArdC